MTRVPVATYRVQLGEDLGFDRARELLPHLSSMGVDTLYLSPPFAAAGGGGYHVVDPTRLDPALGGEEAFDRLADEARDLAMGLLIDIVPNHVKGSDANPWWADVLRHGRGSRYARFFDIDWDRRGGKLVLPTLPAPRPPMEDEHTIRMWWRDARPLLNYRRFFDIDELVCLRQEDPEVFEVTHELILRLVREGKVTGLRVDHVDGLRDPQGYLERLRAAAPDAFIVVEKILAHDEELRPEWPVAGTTGYEAGDAIAGVLTDAEGAAACDATFARALDRHVAVAFGRVVRSAKSEVLRDLFPAEIDRLTERLHRLAVAAGHASIPVMHVRSALIEVIGELDVYRTYARDRVDPEDRVRLERALRPLRSRALRALLEDVLLDPEPDQLVLLRDLQQLSGPAMAKGFEDTALYRHTALVSRNEVGGDPGVPPPSVARFHEGMRERRAGWPGGLTATSTHDSKRSEDVRARIAVLSELPDEWDRRLGEWRRMAPRRIVTRTLHAWQGTDSEELLLFQTLLGSWPLEGDLGPVFTRRIQDAMVKSAREAKLNTSWLDPHEAYEEDLRDHVAALLGNEDFLASFRPFAERVALHGAINALSQTLLRITVPGVPDLYRGAESWFLRLVDPDNRVPVDLDAIARSLRELDARDPDIDELRDSWREGRLKLWVTASALRFRRAHAELFREGSYLPLEVTGPRADHVLAFARRLRDRWAVAAVTRLSTRFSGWPVGGVWDETAILLPPDAPAAWVDALTTERHEAGFALPLPSAFRRLPVALLAPEDRP